MISSQFYKSIAVLLLYAFSHWSCQDEPSSTQRMVLSLDSIYQHALDTPLLYFHMNSSRVNQGRKLVRQFKGERVIYGEYLLAHELLLAGDAKGAVRALEDILIRMKEQANDARSKTRQNQIRDELALAYLRLGEQLNCIEGHVSGSCILPLVDEGIQKQQSATQSAIRHLKELLEHNPYDLGARWLLNVAHVSLGSYPEGIADTLYIPGLEATEDEIPTFKNIAPHVGLAVNGVSGGVSIEDFNNDGHLDLFMTAYGLNDQCRLFFADGEGGYTDATHQAGLSGITSGLNTVHADYDNDGYIDILILRGAWLADVGNHPNSLLRNKGDGTFEDVTERAGLLTYHPTQVAAWADFNLDGHLDLFIGNESNNTWWQDQLASRRSGGQYHRSELYLNNGDGTFTEVAEQVGIDLAAFVKGATWGDVNNDGWPDLFVSVLGKPNKLYINRGGTDVQDWRFEERAALSGVSSPTYAFPTWFWDYDHDGWEDLMVISYDYRYFTSVHDDIAREYLGLPANSDPSKLFRNNGDGTFTDVTTAMGLNRVMYGMGSNFGDIDNDGWLDFYVGTGSPDLRAVIPNRMYRNAGAQSFEDITMDGGFGHIQKGHAVAFADLDRDGDQDVYAVMGGAVEGDVFPNVLFENPDGWHENTWVTLRLEGTTANRSAIGARIEVQALDANGKVRRITRTVGTGGSFGAGSLQQEIGLGDAVTVKSLTITWPNRDRSTSQYSDLRVNTTYHIVEGEELRALDLPKVKFRNSDGIMDEH